MNKRILLIYIFIINLVVQIISLIIYFLTNCAHHYLFLLSIFLFIVELFIEPSLPVYISTPFNKLPKSIHYYTYQKDIICIQKTKNLFIVNAYNNKIEFDMRYCLFKKTYIRDIVLMYYHIRYYNMNKLGLSKSISKKFFQNHNDLFIDFYLLNGKTIRLPMIKNGKEKRSFICSYKLHNNFTNQIGWRKFHWPGNEYYWRHIESYYK